MRARLAVVMVSLSVLSSMLNAQPTSQPRYVVEDGGIVARGPIRHYGNRALYGNNSNSFVLGGDRPLIRYARGQYVYGTFMAALVRGNGPAKWLHLADIISLADVTGHGVGPALVTAVCRAYARGSFATGRSLPELIEQLNTLLLADLPAERFVTYAALLVDPKSTIVQVLSAGQGPIYHYSANDAQLHEYHADGFPLGAMESPSCDPPRQIKLEPGDFILIVTDGFFEWARPDGERFGLERLRSAILELVGQSCEQLISALAARTVEFAEGVPQEDDMTAIMLRYVGTASP